MAYARLEVESVEELQQNVQAASADSRGRTSPRSCSKVPLLVRAGMADRYAGEAIANMYGT